MSIESPCPEDSKLSELLNGDLIEPELSTYADHLEQCEACQQKAGVLSSKGVHAEALHGDATAIDRFDIEAPRNLIERIKQIPHFSPDHPSSVDTSDALSQLGVESVHFSADPTPGGLGRLGQYRILKLLGSGGMGSVFLAEDTKLHRPVAIKVMLPRIAADPIANERFLREARAAASLSSEHIVRIYQVDEEKDLPYLTMEYLTGQSLDEMIQSNTRLDVQDIISIAIGIGRGLADAHENGLIHRDIKPGNIWIQCGNDSSTRVKILDFGLARSNLDNAHLTHVNAIVGTPAFMAPEQARGDKSADARSDLFSLGCVLYYLCTKEVPFKSDTTIGTLMALAVDTPEPPCNRNTSIPLRLSQLIMQLLEKEPSNRTQKARDVLTALKEVASELQSGNAKYVSSEDLKEMPQAYAQLAFSTWGILIPTALLLFAVPAMYSLWNSSTKNEQPNLLSSTSSITDSLKHSNSVSIEANAQIKSAYAQFKLQNPEFEGSFFPNFEDGQLVGLTIYGTKISNLEAIRDLKTVRKLNIEGTSIWQLATIDLSPIQGLPLNRLGLHGGYVTTNLDALQGMPLEELSLTYSQVSDLTPLKGMPLRKLGLWNWAGDDLRPLQGMPLQEINIGGNGKEMDLSPLEGAPLEIFCANISAVKDLTPLRGMPLKNLACSNTEVTDLSPLKDCLIEELAVDGTRVTDLSIVKGWPLKWIKFNYDLPNWRETLQDIPTLERIHDDTAANVLAAFDPSNRPKAKADFTNDFGMEFALVPKGKTKRPIGNFDANLGSRDIEIENDFYLGRFEVTQAQWKKLMGSNPSYFSRSGPGEKKVRALTDTELDLLPVERVSWTDCQRFLENLNKLDEDSQWRYRLPTEAEWIYACQGGAIDENFDIQNVYYLAHATKTLLSYHANFKLCELQRPCRGGLFAPNSLGLHDMHGNVWEWCEDLANVPDKQARWIHGGSWKDEAERCQSSFLLEPTEPWTYYDLGFRVARVRK
jgi:eukaryotic-like serine/threonine-protein kinase